MFLSRDQVIELFQKLAPPAVSPDTAGKAELEKTSSLFRFLAVDALCKDLQTETLQVPPDKFQSGYKNRERLVEKYKDFGVLIGQSGAEYPIKQFGELYPFGEKTASNKIGNDFLTAQVKQAQANSKPKEYPSRPAPLLMLTGSEAPWTITKHPNWKENIAKFLPSHKYITRFVQFLFRDLKNPGNFQGLKDTLASTFTHEVADYLTGSVIVDDLVVGDSESLVDDAQIIASLLEAAPEPSIRSGVTSRPPSELLAKPFLIFTGLSGSGKTRAAREIAHRLAPEERRELVAVGPDWHNRDPLLGYPDGLHHERYLSTPLLNLILRAGSEAGKDYPHFLILDEMNLSHVERYFADFLSAMETPGESISLYEGPARYLDPESETDEIPKEITIPPNLYVIGTVNVDETTYQFSPKVLDRAHVVEFTMKVDDLKPFFDDPEASSLLPAYSEDEAREFQKMAGTQDQAAIQFAADHETFQMEMEQLFAVMQAHRAEFGYRTLKEASRFLYFSLAQTAENKEAASYRDAMDQIILQKLLPKLHGSRGKLEGLLRGLLAYCETSERGDLKKVKGDALAKAKESNPSLDDVGRDESKGHFEKSTAKLRRMCRKLAADQFVSFMEA